MVRAIKTAKSAPKSASKAVAKKTAAKKAPAKTSTIDLSESIVVKTGEKTASALVYSEFKPEGTKKAQRRVSIVKVFRDGDVNIATGLGTIPAEALEGPKGKELIHRITDWLWTFQPEDARR